MANKPLSREFLLNRGYCCCNGCLNCPYKEKVTMARSIHDYVFHFNEYTNLWNAIPRELINDYWNKPKVKGVISSSRIEVLTELINKVAADANFLDKIKQDE
jgi:hypothetical protein